MRMISNHPEDYGNTPVEQWLTAFYTGKNLEKDPDGVLYRFHLSHNDLDGLACHVVSTVYDCALNRFEIPLADLTDALQLRNWEEIHNAHHRTPIRHSICEAGAKNVKEALHKIFKSCCQSIFYKPVGPKDQIILLITDLGGITDSMFDEFYEAYGDRFQAIVIDHHLSTTPDRGKCDPNQIFWYVTGYQEDNLQSATKNLFTATYNPDASNNTASEKQKVFMKQLTEYVEAVSKYDTGRWGEWLDRKTPDDVDLSVQHQLYFNHRSWDTADVFHYTIMQNYVEDMIRLLCMEDYVHNDLQYRKIVSNNLNKLHKEFHDMFLLTLVYNPHVTLTLKIDPIDGVYNPATRHTIRLGDITTNVQPVNNPLHPLVTFGIVELHKDQSQTKEWKYFSLCSHELMKKYKLDLFILVDEPKGTVSLRSMDNHGFEINCANIAWRNGGGGHKRAAGYPIPNVEVPEDDDTEEVEDDGTEEADANDSSEDSDKELIPNTSIGTHVQWAGYDWIVTHVVDPKTIYMTMADVVPNWKVAWNDLQDACTKFANQLTEEQKACLKSVTAGNTSGKVFVATSGQMNGGFSYFNSDDRRCVRSIYWTSTEYGPNSAWLVSALGSLYSYGYGKSNPIGFRPSVCVDLTRHKAGDSGECDESSEGSGEELVLNAYPPIGTNVHWAGHNWIVSHVTSTEVYLTLNGIDGKSTWDNLQNACTTFANSLTEAQKVRLKHVTAGNTSGKVFVATRDQMDGGFSYFGSNSRRRLNGVYWTSTEYSSDSAWSVITDESLDTTYAYFNHVTKSDTLGFRPSVCVDLTRHDSGDSGKSDESKLNSELPDMKSLSIGNTVTFADKEWIVSHETADTFYLTLKGVLGNSTWYDLQENCTNFENSLSEAQRRCLKNVTAGNTSGKVFVATKDQMNGDFSYFDSDSRCSVKDVYWTSTEKTSRNAWGVDSDGCLGKYSYDKSNSIGFRPSIAISTKVFCNDHDISDESDDSEKEDSDEELIPVMDLNKAIRWAGINWRPLQQDDDLLYLTPYEPTDDLKLCTFSELEDVAAEWGAKHLSDSDQSALVPIQINGKSYNVAPITLEHILNIPDARNAKFAQISMPYGNVPYWTGSSAYNGGDTDDMVWCMNEKGQNVPVNKDAFLAFRPMICLHIINALVGNFDDEEKPIVLTPNIPNAYPSIGKHVYWAGNDWIVTHVDLKMVYMTLADVVPEWHVTWDDLQDTCYEWANKTFSAKKMKQLIPITCGNTHGKVWVASKRLMETGLAYFAESEEHRAASCRYWTSTEYSNVSAWNVDANGDIFNLNGIKTCQHGFRPSICMLRSNFGPEDRTVGHYENAEIVNGCRTLIATGMQVMWANQRWIVSNIQPEIIMLTLAHSIPDLMDWEDLQDACNAWGNENLGDQKSKLAYLLVGGICGKVFVATKSDMDGGFDYFTDDDKRCLGECYWTSTKDANGTTYYVDETGKIQSVSGQAMCLDTAPKFTFRPTVAIWTKEFCNDQSIKVVSD